VLSTIRSFDGMTALAPEWNDLAARCPGYFLSQTFQWADAAWRTVASPRGGELRCLTLRDGARLAGIWPLVVRRERGLRIVSPLSGDAGEYSAPLVEPGDAMRLIVSLWREAKRAGDLAILTDVRVGSPLDMVLQEEGVRAVTYQPVGAPCLARADYADWEAYAATLSPRLRYEIRRGRRRLAERGDVSIGREEADAAGLIDWTLECKKRSLAEAGLGGRWIGRRDLRDFLVALAGRGNETGELAVFAVKVDGQPVASHVVSVDRTRIEGYIGAYDPAWGVCSPGNVLTEHVLRWALERGLDVDFRIGDQPYKQRWNGRRVDVATWHVATSLRGLPVVLRWRMGRLARRLGLGRRGLQGGA
jgi:CelD/BcsL family acetyltransferase involved in cellulose biosynthesis